MRYKRVYDELDKTPKGKWLEVTCEDRNIAMLVTNAARFWYHKRRGATVQTSYRGKMAYLRVI